MRLKSVVVAAALMVVPAFATAQNTTIQVVQLSVDGRFDEPLDIGNTRPTLAWQLIQIDDCNEPICPGDRQTAYEVQVAATVEALQAGNLQWSSGKTTEQTQQIQYGQELTSRDTRFWRVRVWDALNQPSVWSDISAWSTGLLSQSDWGTARWIEYPDRTENQPLPLFVRHFQLPEDKEVVGARLYISGVGMHYATVNGQSITDEVLAPGYSNYQLSVEYRTYDIKEVLTPGTNVIGVRLGNGPAYVRRSVTNPTVGRNAPYAWWQSQLKGNGSLIDDVTVGDMSVRLSNVTGYHLASTINIDTGDGGERLESRVISAVDNTTNIISFYPGLTVAHTAGVRVTGSGNNVAATDPSAGAAATPRLIGRLEIIFDNGSTDTIITDRSWRTTLGALVTDQWYSGADYDARREQADWDLPNGQLNSSRWIAAGIAPPPNLATKIVARAAEPVKAVESFVPVSITNPMNGSWVFDLGQNIAGYPLLKLPQMPAGIVVKMTPAESLNADGTVNQSSVGVSTGRGSRGSDVFATYTTAGHPGGETWYPDFNYFAMQWVQVTGLPANFTPGLDLITGVRVQGDVPVAGTFNSSDARINRIHKMSRYSFLSNVMSVFTDCPGREKLSYPADYTQPMGAIYRHVHIDALLRTTMRHLVEAQSIANTSMAGNVALKAPVYDWGYTGRFGDEINWGNAIVLVPSLLHDLYGDTTVMAQYYDQMTAFVRYIQREKVRGYIVDAALADWVENDDRTSGRITGTWGYYLTISAMARMANLTNHSADAVQYSELADQIKKAFNAAFFNTALGAYTNTGNNSTLNATQSAQALALDAGLVPPQYHASVLNALVNLTYTYPSSDGVGPHLSGGTIGLSPIVRALSAGGRDDILYATLQQNDQPSYGYMMQSTPENPDGMTTIGERWTRSDSRNHMILAQIDEWFNAGVAGIKPLCLHTFQACEGDGIVIEPKIVGDVMSAVGTYVTRWGEVESKWNRTGGVFRLMVRVPANTRAEVRLPTGGTDVVASRRAEMLREGVYGVPSGMHTFEVKLRGMNETMYAV